MTSILKVDTIQKADGSAATAASLGISNPASNVLEQLIMLCDGGSYTALSGTYTSANITAAQTFTNSYTDITGSTIAYTPPSGATCVLYEFIFAFAWIDSNPIPHIKFFIDSDEVSNQRHSLSAQAYPQWQQNLSYVMPIGGSANTATGRQSSWTSAKTLKLQARNYGTGNETVIHRLGYWDGANSTTVVMPKLMITAVS